MERFRSELDIGDINFRDKLQFELKSEFSPLPERGTNTYTQEFYFFIPNALQINDHTYTKEQFYRDQTNLIRYKTPEFTFIALANPNNPKSPLSKLERLRKEEQNKDTLEKVHDELKLFGNIFRSTLRLRVYSLIVTLEKEAPEINQEAMIEKINSLLKELKHTRSRFRQVKDDYAKHWASPTLQTHFTYLEEFLSITVSHYLTGLLSTLREHPAKDLKSLDKAVCQTLREEEKIVPDDEKLSEDPEHRDYLLYRNGLLNKFVLDALLLKTSRSPLDQRYKNVIGAFSAGIAMLLYLLLFIWQGKMFVINSEPFILFTVVLYILKDRLKESLKSVSFRKALRWFSDFTTEIQSPDGEVLLGSLKESFSFINPKNLPEEISHIRNSGFHILLDTFKRPENVIYYKRNVILKQQKKARRNKLNIIFRFNIMHFLIKASDPFHPYLALEPHQDTLIPYELPKVYHLNIIMKNTYLSEKGGQQTELRTFRLVIDKEGIKEVDRLS